MTPPTRHTLGQLAGAAARFGLRAALLAAVCFGALLALRAPVEARIDGALLDLGAQMMRYRDALVQDEPRTVVVNGVALHLSAGATADGVAAVLDAYAAGCRDAESADELPFGEPLRAGDAARGFVACLGGGDPLSADGLVERARAFADTGDATALGALRYAYAERRGYTTHFIQFWTGDELAVDRMFPTEGDAPGTDAPGIARPPDSRRRLSLREVGYPYGITIYGGSPRPIRELEDFYRERLEADGWRIVRRSPRSERPTGEAHVVAMRGGALGLVVFGDEPSGTSTTILTTSEVSP